MTRTLVVHFSGGTEVSIDTPVDPAEVYEVLDSQKEWLVVDDAEGERHRLAVRYIAYLTFGAKKDIGFS